MKHNESLTANQLFATSSKENLSRDLGQALKIINAEYQQIDWEDQAFLNRVLTDALLSFEAKGGNHANN